MPKNFRRKKRTPGTAHKLRINKGKNYTYDNPAAVKASIGDEDLPGEGNFYCHSCCRYFKSPDVLGEHESSKAHKKTVKKRKWEEEAERREEERVKEYRAKRTRLGEQQDVIMASTDNDGLSG